MEIALPIIIAVFSAFGFIFTFINTCSDVFDDRKPFLDSFSKNLALAILWPIIVIIKSLKWSFVHIKRAVMEKV